MLIGESNSACVLCDVRQLLVYLCVFVFVADSDCFVGVLSQVSGVELFSVCVKRKTGNSVLRAVRVGAQDHCSKLNMQALMLGGARQSLFLRC